LANPREENVCDMLEMVVEKYGFKGLKMHPSFLGVAANDREWVYPIAEKALARVSVLDDLRVSVSSSSIAWLLLLPLAPQGETFACLQRPRAVGLPLEHLAQLLFAVDAEVRLQVDDSFSPTD
jgi:hypothetical protein